MFPRKQQLAQSLKFLITDNIPSYQLMLNWEHLVSWMSLRMDKHLCFSFPVDLPQLGRNSSICPAELMEAQNRCVFSRQVLGYNILLFHLGNFAKVLTHIHEMIFWAASWERKQILAKETSIALALPRGWRCPQSLIYRSLLFPLHEYTGPVRKLEKGGRVAPHIL